MIADFFAAWVRSLEEEDEDEDAASQLLPKAPPGLQIAQHNNSPAFKGKHKHEPVRGRLHDADREWAPPTPRSHVTEIGSRWRSFADASAYPPISSDTGQQVTEEWLIQNGTDYSQPWRVALLRDEQDARTGGFSTSTKRKVWWKKSQRIVLRSPIIPLVVRTIVWVFSLIALVLGCSIYRHVKSEDTVLANEETSLNQGTSPLMAIIVDAFALVYLVYITYDEYTGKPLGLRSAKAKLRLIFLDLFFIIFDSANLSLAFEALSIHSQAESPGLGKLPSQQEALASVLLIALIAWMMTFSVSVLRYIKLLATPMLTAYTKTDWSRKWYSVEFSVGWSCCESWVGRILSYKHSEQASSLALRMANGFCVGLDRIAERFLIFRGSL
ncbi:hypothetical protein MMC14_005195 [Varicellaria rhodocarpa]|nr:hypothetical protein [Varicellaria rhodocarpa]